MLKEGIAPYRRNNVWKVQIFPYLPINYRLENIGKKACIIDKMIVIKANKTIFFVTGCWMSPCFQQVVDIRVKKWKRTFYQGRAEAQKNKFWESPYLHHDKHESS